MTADVSSAMPENADAGASALPAARPRRRSPDRGKRGGRLDKGRVTIRLSADERAAAEQKATAAGLDIAGYFRLAGLGYAGTGARRRTSIDVAALARLQAQLGHIGGNINQIARAINYNDPVEAPVIVKALNEHRALVLQISDLLRNTLTP